MIVEAIVRNVPRPPKYSNEQILDAVIKVVREAGPAAVSVAAIADAMGAPNGSIYHRFSSRDELLAAAWLRIATTFQQGFAQQLSEPDPFTASIGAATYTIDRARRRPADTQVLCLYRPGDLTKGSWPRPLAESANRLASQLTDLLRLHAQRLGGVSVTRVRFALVDVPNAAVRRAVSTGAALDHEVERLVRETVSALLRPEAQEGPTNRMSA